MIKIEYCRTLHRSSKEPHRSSSLSFLPATEKAPICGSPATKIPSVSTFSAAFLTETTSHSEIAVNHSKQTGGTFLTETRIARSSAFPTSVPGAFFGTNSSRPRPFLTGSAPQTELTVTHSQQTLEKILTGARMHINEFANPHFSAPENLLLHRRPIQIFLRPTI